MVGAFCAVLVCGWGSAQDTTVWTNPSGGVWNDAGNWNNGVPDGNKASLTLNTASYIVDIESAPVPAIMNLTAQNTASQTTLLNVNTGTLAVTKGAILIETGAEVCIKSNACLSFTGGSTTDFQGFFKTRSGGKLRVDGGSVCFTGVTFGSKGAIVGFCGAGSAVVTSGVFQLSGSGNPPLHIARGENAKGYFEAAGSSRVDVAQLTIGMYGQPNSPAAGRLEVKGDSVFTVGNSATVNVPLYNAPSGINNTGIVEVSENALLTCLGSYFDLGYATGASTNLGVLRVTGSGRFAAPNATLRCGNTDAGSAIFEVGDNGVCEIKNLYLNGNTTATLNGNGRCFVTGSSAPRIGNGAACSNVVLQILDQALFAVTNATLYCGYDNSTAEIVVGSNAVCMAQTSRFYGNSSLTVCGDGCYTGMVADTLNDSDYIGYNAGKVVLNVSGNGRFLTKRNLNIGYFGAEGEVNVSGNGRLSTGCDFVIGYVNSSAASKAAVNLSGNGVIAPSVSGRGLHMAVVGNSSTSVISNGMVQAWLNISDGLFDMTKDMWNADSFYEEGIIAGEIWKNNQGAAEAWINLSGGTVTNAGKMTAGMGLGATGVVTQTGGALNQGVTAAGGFNGRRTVLGWGGGCGEYRLSGGTAVFGGSVYVGGITTNLLGYVLSDTKFTFEPDSAGLLRVEGGSLNITNNGTLWCGGYGRGAIEIGTGGVCVAKNIVLTNNTQSVVRFELGAEGCGVLRATDALRVCEGARLEVDAQAYRSREVRLKLIDFGTRTGAFAPENVMVRGAGKVVQDEQGVWFYRPRGMVVQIN